LTKCDIFARDRAREWESKRVKNMWEKLFKRIKTILPDFKQKKTRFGLWGSDQVRKLDFLGQEMVLMKMD